MTVVSGSGKTTMVLECVIPGLQPMLDDKLLPAHVKSVSAPGIKHVKLIDSTPIGANVRYNRRRRNSATDCLKSAKHYGTFYQS